MNKSKIKYCLGIDGGGTKTEFLLTDIHSAEIKRLVLGSSNPVNEGLDAAKAILKEGIHAVCGGIDLGEISVFAGIAGGGTSVNKKAISDFLGSFGFGAFSNGSDTDSVLQAALKGENGVAVIMGTGIVAFSQSDGECHRTGGRGYMIDKGGSGFHFGSDALNRLSQQAAAYPPQPSAMNLILERIPVRNLTVDLVSIPQSTNFLQGRGLQIGISLPNGCIEYHGEQYICHLILIYTGGKIAYCVK